MATSSPPRIGRGKALLALALFTVALAAIAVGPHLWSDQLSNEIAAQSDVAAQQKRVARKLAVSNQRLAALNDPKIAESMLLQGGTIGLYGAALQRQVSDIALKAGVAPQSLRVADPEEWKEGLVKISIEIGAQAPLQSIQALLYDIETALPLLFVEQLTLIKPDSNLRGNATAPLDVTLVIRGLALKEPTL